MRSRSESQNGVGSCPYLERAGILQACVHGACDSAPCAMDEARAPGFSSVRCKCVSRRVRRSWCTLHVSCNVSCNWMKPVWRRRSRRAIGSASTVYTVHTHMCKFVQVRLASKDHISLPFPAHDAAASRTSKHISNLGGHGDPRHHRRRYGYHVRNRRRHRRRRSFSSFRFRIIS